MSTILGRIVENSWPCQYRIIIENPRAIPEYRALLNMQVILGFITEN